VNEKMEKKRRRPVQICPRGLPEDGAATVAIEADRETHVVTDWLDRIGQDTVIAGPCRSSGETSPFRSFR
jgi:hypothetical protein